MQVNIKKISIFTKQNRQELEFLTVSNNHFKTDLK
jgi:hypothetical protein